MGDDFIVLSILTTCTMSFSFNFSGDDIDESIDQGNDVPDSEGSSTMDNETAEPTALVEVKQHVLQDLVGRLVSFTS